MQLSSGNTINACILLLMFSTLVSGLGLAGVRLGVQSFDHVHIDGGDDSGGPEKYN